MKAAYHIRVADNLLFFGFMLLSAEPPLILLTVRLYLVSAIAVALWLASIVLGYRIRREFRGPRERSLVRADDGVSVTRLVRRT